MLLRLPALAEANGGGALEHDSQHDPQHLQAARNCQALEKSVTNISSLVFYLSLSTHRTHRGLSVCAGGHGETATPPESRCGDREPCGLQMSVMLTVDLGERGSSATAWCTYTTLQPLLMQRWERRALTLFFLQNRGTNQNKMGSSWVHAGEKG